jgi:peptidoglycan/xylan/chitin deacetylase (PgdA/CDA1 family)/glycosyltransferase involved in cell wall biosynthesis/SAM-dependent methyltransferase
VSRPRVAVIITCYDLGRTLDEAVQSVEAQTLPPAEFVIVDDGSTDVYTRQVLARLERHGHHVIRIPNGGVSGARNHGIRLTTAPYIALLDADDLFAPTYLERAAAMLDENAALGFVSCGMRCFGAADEVWVPPPPNLIESLTRGVVPVSSMFRRAMWEAVGGFDEQLPAHEEVDFWTTVLEHGFEGVVLPEPLLHYRIRSGSMYQAAIRRDTHVALMERFFRKHAATLDADPERVLLAKERFLQEQREHRDYLQGRKAALEEELQRLHAEIGQTLDELRSVGGGRVDFGDLRRTTPISPVWGMDRGIPLDRYYIHSFLDRHRADVRGRVLEIKDPSYARMYGDDRVTTVDVLDVDPDNDQATIVADLTKPEGLPADTYDCFILTQTLGLLFDVPAAIANACRLLKPGGVLLCTMPASGRISYEPPALDGDYWRFTEASVRELFAAVFPLEAFDVTGYGNVLAAAAFLYGVAPDELNRAELDEYDPFFPVVYAIRAVKPTGVQGSEHEARAVSVVRFHTPADIARAGVLMYHRIAVEAIDRHDLCVPPSEFREQLQYLRIEGYRVVPLGDLVRMVTAGTLPSRAAAITIDDGYVDALDAAAPILTEFGFPATFFIVGRALEPGYEYWWDALPRIFLSDADLPERVSLSLPQGDLAFPTQTREERERAQAGISHVFYTLPREVRERASDQLVRWSGLGPPDGSRARPMNEGELLRLTAIPGMSVGAHGYTHCLLPAQTKAVQLEEMVRPKQILESLVHENVIAFSYPYGGVDEVTRDAARDAGYTVAVTTEEGVLTATTNHWAIPRFDIKTGPLHQFAARMRHLFRLA